MDKNEDKIYTSINFESDESDDEAQEKTLTIVSHVVGLTFCLYHDKYKHMLKQPCMTSHQTGEHWVREVLHGHPGRCLMSFRMSKEIFFSLIKDMTQKYDFKGSRRISLEEKLAMFLQILGHRDSNRDLRERFQHSGETISRNFENILLCFSNMAKDIIVSVDPSFTGIPEHIANDERYMSYFQNCIGAIDGTHVRACISVADQVPYIGRKGIPTQNVMAICDFNMCFTFVLAGWEGTTHDAKIFYEAVRRPERNFPHPPLGKYYLVDVGYPALDGYLGPYKGKKYHLPDFRHARGPVGPQAVFNQRHSSLCSVIERTFGIWKKKWTILDRMSSYPFDKQVRIVVATMVLHNYIRRHASRNHGDFTEEEEEEDHHEIIVEDDSNNEEQNESSHMENIQMKELRDHITAMLMSNI